MLVSENSLRAFREALTDYFRLHGRHDMLWRQAELDGSFDPYKIMVSEIMLQQTQVGRVTPKYIEFLKVFPTVRDLATAPLADVLTIWSGLGYNRRAKFLWQAASVVVDQYDGAFPITIKDLQKLPGIGVNTAGAILAYAYDAPVLFLETNIRTVIIHHFFTNESDVSDKDIVVVLAEVLPFVTSEKDVIASNREFYWAMMDYGAYLKKTVGNKNKASKTYAKQSIFHGSKRQLRGQALRLLTQQPLPLSELQTQLNDARSSAIISDLAAEKLIRIEDNVVRLG